jgi:septum formation protein
LRVLLASRSPRRAELLTAAGIPFQVRSADIDETPRKGESAREYVLRLAEEKACAVRAVDSEIVLAADTTVVLGDEILGKPADSADAARMLAALSGQRHQVLTGVCVRRSDGRQVLDVAVTDVWFSAMSAGEIAEYVASGEPLDKAGSYGIQGLASRWVTRIEGSYTNVVGLPVALVYGLLREAGL